ncbi:hypothetical protein [Cellulomonas edaphi]|uniref:Uncharacterized protein n=1 Tax=Cellulomonas edaphi TaxID=3053468 RepID=A0ABT7S2S1_9CELL|nr:hypothetical protein [Cellulomons edaphi]MDM7829917.1 hypothetical protein [Cellulomons edaphi]
MVVHPDGARTLPHGGRRRREVGLVADRPPGAHVAAARAARPAGLLKRPSVDRHARAMGGGIAGRRAPDPCDPARVGAAALDRPVARGSMTAGGP